MGTVILQVAVGALVLGGLGGAVLVGCTLVRWARLHPGESALAAIGLEARDALGSWVDEVNESGSWFGHSEGESTFDLSDWLDTGSSSSGAGDSCSDDGGGGGCGHE